MSLKINNALKNITALLSKNSSSTANALKNTSAVVSGYRRSTAPTALPLHKILTTKLFPLSINESIRDYAERKNLDHAQENLLKLLPFHYTNENLGDFRVGKIMKVDIGDGNHINEYVIMPRDADYSKLNHFVLIHGYGAGLGFYLKNYEEISQNKNWCIHALDLLGYGCSSRPKYNGAKYSLETYFADSLEKWRQARQIDHMLLCSHSLGSYMSIIYAMKYPKYIKKLLNISPAGIYKPADDETVVPIWFNWLWEQNISPFSLVRNTGPFGSLITSGWSSRRFAKLSKEEQVLLHKYTYAIFNAPGSGEYYMSEILGAGGVAKVPLIDRMDEVKCDTAWVYGDEDWMPKEGGLKSIDIIRQNGDYEGDFVIMKNSGHHLYLDNYRDFNQFILNEMERYEQRHCS